VIQPGDHGSTFAGNPLAAAMGLAALEVIAEESLTERSRELDDYLLSRLSQIQSERVREIRGRGLLAGIELHPEAGPARDYALRLLELGILTKDTHESVIRLAPPLVIEKKELDWLVEQLQVVLT